VIHVELPWNPVRLEQRTGRVDRIGQARTVHAVHLIARGTGEMRILARLQSRIRDARRDIPVADPLRSPDDPGIIDIAVDDERASLDAALGSRDGDGCHPDASGPPSEEPPDRQIVRLADEAAAETCRIHRSRAYGTGGEDPTTREVSLARGTTRAVLRGRAIVLVGFGLEDSCGRRIAAHVSPLLVEPAARNARREPSAAVSSWLESAALARVVANDRARADWEKESAHTHHVFWQAALQRGLAIEQAIRQAPAAPFQPGLFDHRIEHERSLLGDEHRDLAADLTRRCSICQEALTAGPAIIRTVLVLLP
jgi:hypothetical protein